MKAHVHFYVDTLHPDDGGLALSANRLVSHLVSMSRTRVTVYEKREPRGSYAIPDGAEVVSLFDRRSQIMAPFRGSDVLAEVSEVFRANYLTLRDAVRSRVEADHEYRHILLSFYISAAGFVAQQVADELGTPHIASVRGTDFNRDFRSPHRLAGVRFVLERAASVVTTCKAQAATLRPFLGERTRLRTIYNAAAPSSHHRRRRRDGEPMRLFADGGFSSKKGSHILLAAVEAAILAGHPVHLSIAGAVDPAARPYWTEQRQRRLQAHPRSFSWLDHVSHEHVATALASADLYCSASLGEGASNGLTQAMVDGVPIVATDIGAFPELAGGARHVAVVPAGNGEAYADALCRMLRAEAAGGLVPTYETLEEWRRLLAPARERHEWEEVLAEVLPKHSAVRPRRQRRVLFFVNDGAGLGHLHRMARLADAIQGPAAALVVAAHRSAGWIVPEGCEYVHLPSFDSLFPRRAQYWGRRPFLECSRREAILLRRRLVEAVVEQFAPDAIVADHFPLGAHGELRGLIGQSRAQKYCILRGVLDHAEDVRLDVLSGESEAALAESYARVLVACDRRICDPAVEYAIAPGIAAQMRHIGYVSDPLPAARRARVRSQRGLGPADRWVVCSAGGGAFGERLIDACLALASTMPELHFDIVHGPRSAVEWTGCATDVLAYGRVRVFRESRYLAELHGAADLVIGSGGYNTLVEVMEGGAPLVCIPMRLDTNQEQAIQAQRLSAFYPLEIVHDVGDIGATVERMLRAPRSTHHIRTLLDFGGRERFRAVLLEDLGISDRSAQSGRHESVRLGDGAVQGGE